MLVHTEAADLHVEFLRVQTVGFAIVHEDIDNITDRISPRVAEHYRSRPHMICTLEGVDICNSILTIDRTFGILSLLTNDAVRVEIAWSSIW